MDVLEQRKYEAILFTFKQVSKYFQVSMLLKLFSSSDMRCVCVKKLARPFVPGKFLQGQILVGKAGADPIVATFRCHHF